ncbi:MAG: hypothetical protein V3V19_06135 [Cocleimonas sp.]
MRLLRIQFKGAIFKDIVFEGAVFKGIVKVLALAACLISLCAVSACASENLPNGKTPAKIAQASSCEHPVILKHALKGDLKDSLSGNDVPEVERIARVRMMGYEGATPASTNICADKAVTKYQLVSNAGENISHFYAKHMTKAAIKADPNVRCRPKFKQLYQPPTKLDGAGKVLNLPDGEKCEVSHPIDVETNIVNGEPGDLLHGESSMYDAHCFSYAFFDAYIEPMKYLDSGQDGKISFTHILTLEKYKAPNFSYETASYKMQKKDRILVPRELNDGLWNLDWRFEHKDTKMNIIITEDYDLEIKKQSSVYLADEGLVMHSGDFRKYYITLPNKIPPITTDAKTDAKLWLVLKGAGINHDKLQSQLYEQSLRNGSPYLQVCKDVGIAIKVTLR